MDFPMKYCILLYIVLIVLLYIKKPHWFQLRGEEDDSKRKNILLYALIIILAIICIYMKVMVEWFFY